MDNHLCSDVSRSYGLASDRDQFSTALVGATPNLPYRSVTVTRIRIRKFCIILPSRCISKTGRCNQGSSEYVSKAITWENSVGEVCAQLTENVKVR